MNILIIVKAVFIRQMVLVCVRSLFSCRSDPEKVPGLAHFLEHMLFLGTEKYPVEGQYRQFLTRHGGIENAYTIYENTNFYFSAMGSLDVFTEALDR